MSTNCLKALRPLISNERNEAIKSVCQTGLKGRELFEELLKEFNKIDQKYGRDKVSIAAVRTYFTVVRRKVVPEYEPYLPQHVIENVTKALRVHKVDLVAKEYNLTYDQVRYIAESGRRKAARLRKAEKLKNAEVNPGQK